jgi:hypothetical protein
MEMSGILDVSTAHNDLLMTHFASDDQYLENKNATKTTLGYSTWNHQRNTN